MSGETEQTPEGLSFQIAGSGPAVLLLHAGVADSSMWDPQWQALTERYTAIRYDARGFGRSSDPDGPYAMHADAASVLAAAGVEQAALVGASMGGRALLDLALVRPEVCWALVTVASTPSGWEHDEELEDAFGWIEQVYDSEGVDAANEAELRTWVDGPQRWPDQVDPEVRAYVSRINRELIVRQGELPDEEVPIEPPAIARLDELDVPTLVITGALDQPSVNAGSAALAERTAARGFEIAGAAHLPSLERPELFTSELLAFLDANAPGS